MLHFQSNCCVFARASKKATVILLLLLCASIFSFGQKGDSIEIHKVDTLNDLILKDYSAKVAAMEDQRLKDSISKAELEKEISLLKASDNSKKGALQAKVDVLNNKEAFRIQQKKAQIDLLRKNAIGAPVIPFFNDTLFLVYSSFGSFSAQDRADATTKRIRDLADNYAFSPDSLAVIDAETSVGIVYKDKIIASISENDALWNNTTKDSLAQKCLIIVKKAIKDYREKTSFKTIAKEVGLAALCIFVIAILIYFIAKFFKWTSNQIQHQEGKKFKGFKIKNYTLFDSQKQLNLLQSANTIVKWAVILISIYIALPILFGIFPSTVDLADQLFGYILNPIKSIAGKLWDYLPNLFTIIVIVIIFKYVLKLLKFLKAEIETGNLTLPGFYQDWANPTFQIVRVLVYAFMLVVIFPYLPGSDSPVFKGVSVFLGFLFTFGSAGSLSNVISGLVLTYMRLFKIGDRVKIGDVVGDVIEKSMLVTRIRTTKNELISIPNSTVMSSHTINYSSDAPLKGLILHTTVTIGYDVPWKDMHQALIDAALRTEFVLQDPLPFVLQTGLEDFYVAYQINAYVRESNKQATIYSLLHQNIQDVCNERGIEIMSPHYRAERDGNKTTIPENYLKPDEPAA
jgi:small-conductance mechanosensitive channel